jgi:hypothetical protein
MMSICAKWKREQKQKKIRRMSLLWIEHSTSRYSFRTEVCKLGLIASVYDGLVRLLQND